MSAFNGSGTYVITGLGLPFVTGTTISSTVANQLNTDLATGLSTCITKDGQTTPIANIPMGGFKLTGLAAPTAPGDAVSNGNPASLGALKVNTTLEVQFAGSSTNEVLIQHDGGNGYIRTQAGPLNIGAGGLNVLQVTANGLGFIPLTNNTVNLGVGANRWSGVYGVIGDFSGKLSSTTWIGAGTATVHGTESLRVNSGGGQAIYIDNGDIQMAGGSINCTNGSIFSGNNVTATGFGCHMSMVGLSIGTDGAFNFDVYAGGASTNFARLPVNNGNWSAMSDETMKTPFAPFVDALSKVSQIRSGIARYLTDEEGTRRSFLGAQSVRAVLPEAVSVGTSPEGTPDPWRGKLIMAYTDVIPLLVAALKEANDRIIALEAR